MYLEFLPVTVYRLATVVIPADSTSADCNSVVHPSKDSAIISDIQVMYIAERHVINHKVSQVNGLGPPSPDLIDLTYDIVLFGNLLKNSLILLNCNLNIFNIKLK